MARGVRLKLLGLGLLMLQPVMLCAADVQWTITTDDPDAFYAVGSVATWTVKLTCNGQPATGYIDFETRTGGKNPGPGGSFGLSDGQIEIMEEGVAPGTMLLDLTWERKPKEVYRAVSAVVFDPGAVAPSAPAPEDFDTFWAAKLAELEQVPLNAQLEAGDSGDPQVEYHKITLDNVRGTHVQGQLAKPKGKTHLPAVLRLQSAGIYPLEKLWVVGPASGGWLTMNISAHDVLIDQAPAYYDKLGDDELMFYFVQGNKDREESYWLRIVLACCRAVDYLASSPDWDGQTMVVEGYDQGGGLAVSTAALRHMVSGIAVDCPAMCDATGRLINRAPGWPRDWLEDDDLDYARPSIEVSRYFDAVNFASRVRSRSALVSIGLLDSRCPPDGVLAMVNQLNCDKTCLLRQGGVHMYDEPSSEEYSTALSRWLGEQLKPK